ncbi:hypothetical protein [Amycolatopsis australiensis]|uniref:hypothetical protein n=1 Tax=Amycolatopsis australiensis TaxID=546364 RepID=UPI001161130A|nr:hypothetical protein [Amycolatopsis australiensis]
MAEFAWWEMHCDRNHVWWRSLSAAAEPSANDLVCPVDGEQAVTAGSRALADRAELRLIPAAWDDEGVVGFEDEYFVQITDHASGQFLRSAKTFDFDAACKRLSWFRRMTWPDAEREWGKVGLGETDDSAVAGSSVSFGETCE